MFHPFNMKEKVDADFCLEIDYKKGSTNPSRVFRAMSDLIESTQALDITLINSIDHKIQPVLLLEDIEAASIKAWLRTLLESTEDEALKKLDWKPQVGKYLVKAKYFLIDFLKDKTEITDKKQLQEAQHEILQLAEETKVKEFPAYTPITIPNLITGIDLLNNSLKTLQDEDKVKFLSDEGNTNFNLKFNFVPKEIEDLLTREKLESNQDMILKIKKPDYLGDSRWDLMHDKIIPAKILDEEWLHNFQTRKIDIRPGDSIKVNVKVTVKYGYDNAVIATTYEIIKVYSVIPNADSTQTNIF